MRKLLALTLIACLLGCQSALASDADVLARSQSVCETFLDVYDAQPAPAYGEIARLLNDELKEKFSAGEYSRFRANLAKDLGEMRGVRFVAFERFDQIDRLTYFATFEKEKVVLLSFGFTKDGRLEHFLLTPQKQEAQSK